MSESYPITNPFSTPLQPLPKQKGPIKNPFGIPIHSASYSEETQPIITNNTDNLNTNNANNNNANNNNADPYSTFYPKFSSPSFQEELSGKISLQAGSNVNMDAGVEGEEPPLLEDLGIDLENIKSKTLAVLFFKKCDEKFVKEADMSGPLLLALIYGSLLMINGKIHFGSIYGFEVFGCMILYFIMNFISQNKYLELYNTVSILGYCLLPIVLLSAVNIFLDLRGFIGFFISSGAIGWASMIAAYFFQSVLDLNDQKWIVAYPVCLFYSTFVLITIF